MMVDSRSQTPSPDDRPALFDPADAVHRLLAEHSSDMIVRSDLSFRRKYVSSGCLRMFGYTCKEMLALDVMDMLHPNDLPTMEAARRALVGGQDRVETSYRMRHRDGRWIWVEARTALVRDDAGQPFEVVGIVRDVTARHEAASHEARASAELRAANALLRRAEAMAHIGHWRLDVVTQDLFWSEEIYRIYGLPDDRRPTLQSGIEGYHPEDRARVTEIVAEAIRGGLAFSFDLRIVRPDGEVRHVTAHGEAERAPDGSLTALVGTFQDNTERRLLEIDLRQAHKLEAIGRVAAGIAHDFNNVLQGIMGRLQRMLDPDVAAADLRGDAALAMTSARRGAAITQGLLSYARQQALNPRRILLQKLLDEVGGMLLPALDRRIELRIECDPACPMVEVDPQRLLSALLNLAQNSISAMPEGGVLTLRAASSRGAALLSVCDTGIGMDAAAEAQAFEPFFTTKGFHGAGLGLSMVEGFVRQSGGDIWIDSALGKGTTVMLRLAGAAPPVADGGDATSAAPRILLVDDASDVLVVCAAFLRRAGFEVVQAASGDAALSLLARDDRIDALVTDYAMPGLNGIDLILHAREARPGLGALLITGFIELVGVIALPGGVEVLKKPFQREDLAAALSRVLARMRPLTAGSGSTGSAIGASESARPWT